MFGFKKSTAGIVKDECEGGCCGTLDDQAPSGCGGGTQANSQAQTDCGCGSMPVINYVSCECCDTPVENFNSLTESGCNCSCSSESKRLMQ